MSAVFDSGNSAHAAGAPNEVARASARTAGLALVVGAFGAAYALGSASKTTSAAPAPGQLAPVSALQGQSSVHIAVPGAVGSIPALAQAAKPKPAHHAQAAAQTQASASQTQSAPIQTTTSQTVQQQPVVQQPVAQQPVVQQPVHQRQPQQPVVVVHHG